MPFAYSVLHSGSTGTILRPVTPWNRRTTAVTTVPIDRADALANSLSKLQMELPAALYPVACEFGSTPANASGYLRELISNESMGAQFELRGGPWATAENLAQSVGVEMRELSEAQREEAWEEVCRLVDEYDGILVAGVVESDSRGPFLRLVINSTLALDEEFIEMAELGSSVPGYLEAAVGCDGFRGLDGVYGLVDGLHGCSPAANAVYNEEPVEFIANYVGVGEIPWLYVHAEALVSWVKKQSGDAVPGVLARLEASLKNT